MTDGGEMIATRSALKDGLRQALRQFNDSDRKFQVVYSTQKSITPTKSLYVLDSSFNPPTLAHYRIARTALDEDPGPAPKRLLLLLATHNADKASKHDTFEDRLLMMRAFADQVHNEAPSAASSDNPPIDVGITKEPYFHHKAVAIEESKTYTGSPQQVHLTGFDTLIRIFNTKYYPPDHTFACLEPFLSRHRLRVTYRTDDEWGNREAQEQYVRDFAEGKREHEGGKREWAKQIQMVEGKKKDEQPVSSTRARKAAKESDWTTLKTLVPSSVQEVIESEHLYVTD